MTDKKFVKQVNPELYHNGMKLKVTPYGICVFGSENDDLVCLPIPLKYETAMWERLRKIAEYKMLKKLES